MVRSRVIVGGLTLGGLLAAVLVLAGVVHVRVTGGHAADPTPSPRLGPLTATQPELREALLAAADLPDGYRKTSAPRTAAGPDRRERCRALLGRPGDVARDWAAGRAVGDFAGRRDGTLLRQALTLFGPDGAQRAFGELRAASGACPEFDARLDDGTAVRVHLREMALRGAGHEASAVRAPARGESGTREGYLAVGRVGAVLSVLRHLGPAGTVDPDDVADTLRRALDRAKPLGQWPASPGKMETCRLCASPSPR
ncbi:hypothetical protein K1W54_14665 [Micromonospora sp. CPCC 205371]|nr:hypothetical protein [Micromonospora sp. CPCC 205371]